MMESKADKLVDAILPYVMLGCIGMLVVLVCVAVFSMCGGNPERLWLRDCAKHRPLVECRKDWATLEQQR